MSNEIQQCHFNIVCQLLNHEYKDFTMPYRLLELRRFALTNKSTLTVFHSHISQITYLSNWYHSGFSYILLSVLCWPMCVYISSLGRNKTPQQLLGDNGNFQLQPQKPDRIIRFTLNSWKCRAVKNTLSVIYILHSIDENVCLSELVVRCNILRIEMMTKMRNDFQMSAFKQIDHFYADINLTYHQKQSFM